MESNALKFGQNEVKCAQKGLNGLKIGSKWAQMDSSGLKLGSKGLKMRSKLSENAVKWAQMGSK